MLSGIRAKGLLKRYIDVPEIRNIVVYFDTDVTLNRHLRI